jgi:hypothetical protein
LLCTSTCSSVGGTHARKQKPHGTYSVGLMGSHVVESGSILLPSIVLLMFRLTDY